MFWISDKETFVTADEFGHDLEHVEVKKKLNYIQLFRDFVSFSYDVKSKYKDLSFLDKKYRSFQYKKNL